MRAFEGASVRRPFSHIEEDEMLDGQCMGRSDRHSTLFWTL